MQKFVLNRQWKLASYLFLVGLLLLGVISYKISGRNFLQIYPKVFAQSEDLKVDLSISPGVQSVTAGQNFSVDVEINGKGNQVSAADVEVYFDPEFLQLQTVNSGSYLEVVLIAPQTDNENGKASFTLGASVGNYPTGNGILANLQFKALKDTVTPTKIIINPESEIAVIGQSSNMLGAIGNTAITVGEASHLIKTASFLLSSLVDSPKIGEEFGVVLTIVSSVDAANLFVSNIDFDPAFFEVKRIETDGSVVSQWISNDFDNEKGIIKLIGGVPSPGFTSSEDGSVMAVIYFQPKKSGLTTLDFINDLAIYRNRDNADILNTSSQLNLDILSSVSPSSVTTPTPSPSLDPSPSISPIACSITSAEWNTRGPVLEGTFINLTVTGTGDCTGKLVSYMVKEDDNLLGSQFVSQNPVSAIFNNNSASSSWISEYQEDGFFGVWDPPEYYFTAQVNNDSVVFKSANRLTVDKLFAGQSVKGDGNNDGEVGLKDLSILFSNWNKETGFPVNLDVNDDGVINTFDFSGIIKLLNTKGLI